MSSEGKRFVSWNEFRQLCARVKVIIDITKYGSVYGIPKSGLYVAFEISKITGLPITMELQPDSLVVDDLVDTGITAKEYQDNDILVICQKERSGPVKKYMSIEQSKGDEWIVFPWETGKEIETSVFRQLEYLGEDPTREGLLETPSRVRRSWETLYGGYREEPGQILRQTFGQEQISPNPVILKNIEFFSTCEHHLLPFFGEMSVAYVPDKRIVGISKLARLVDCYARRAQIQERLTEQVAGAIEQYLRPKFVYVYCEAQHFCIVARGVRKERAKMVTTAYRGDSAWIEQVQKLL